MTLHIVRQCKMNTGAAGNPQQSFDRRDLVRFSWKRTHDPADAGWEVHRFWIPNNLAGQVSFARVRHLRAPLPERLSADSARQEIERPCERDYGAGSGEGLDQMTGAERQPRGNFYRRKAISHRKRSPMGHLRMPRNAKTLGQGTGVNVDWAGSSAKTIHRAGIEDHVGEIAIKRSAHLEIVGPLTEPLHCAPHHDSLPRRQGQVAARTFGLAIPALDAFVDLRFHFRHQLQVADVGVRMGIENHTWIKQVLGIDQRFQLAHDRKSLRPPLGLNKRRHIATCPVLGFKRPIVAMHDQAHHVFDERAILGHAR